MEWIVLSLIVVAVAGLIVIGLRRRRTNRDRLSAIPDIGRMANAAVIAEAQARGNARVVDTGTAAP